MKTVTSFTLNLAAAVLIVPLLLLWTLPAYASECCQYGVTYNSPASEALPTCEDFTTAFVLCKRSGGKLVPGKCQKDGACSGSTICCQGSSIGGACGVPPLQGDTALPTSCAEALESACDAKGAGGERTESMPGAYCGEASNGTPAGCFYNETPPK